jgi:hypothetical protein
MITPVEYAENIFCLNRAPLVMPPHSMRHLYPIYNKPVNSILLKFGRQTHKSTTIGFKIALPCLKYENYHSLYVAPTGQQMSVFSTDKLDGALNDSDVIKNHYFDTRTKNQISYKEFTNGSKIYLRSAFHSADSIRGISADQTCIDEIQDVCSDHIPVIEQCMGHSLAKWKHLKEKNPTLPVHLFASKIYSGTPKTIENTMERYWDKSTQNEWIIKCQNTGCKKYNYINENNIGPTCLICNKCGKPIFYEHGQWVAMNPSGFIDGYRLPQIVLNWINDITNPQAWKLAVINARQIYSTEKFFNEVLAMAYAAAKHPISVAELMACCQPYDMITEESYDMNPMLNGCSAITAGIDWGKGDTSAGTSYSVLIISAFIRGKFKTIFVKKYTGRSSEPISQVQDMIRIIRKFRVNFTMADTGDGRTSNAMMVEALGGLKFAEIMEHGTIRTKIRWDKKKGHYIMNRTRIMTDLIMEIKRAEVEFFNYDQFKEYQPDFTGIYSEYSERTRQMLYDHNVPDDCFHSWMFSRIAMAIIRGQYNQYLTGGSNED